MQTRVEIARGRGKPAPGAQAYGEMNLEKLDGLPVLSPAAAAKALAPLEAVYGGESIETWQTLAKVAPLARNSLSLHLRQ